MRVPHYSYVYEEQDADLRREMMRYLCKTDLWFLLRHVLNYDKLEITTDIHLRLCKELQEDPERYMLLIPRGWFKTSIMMGYCVQLLLKDSAHEIGVGSDTATRATVRVDDMRDMVKNELLVSLFPEIFFKDPEHEAPLWTKAAFTVNRPPRTGGFKLPSVTAFGFDPMPVGSHYSFVWIDDLENDDNSRNDEQITKLNSNLSAFFPILPPQAPIVISGTIWAGDGNTGTGPNTVYQTRPGWKVYKRRAREGDGHRPNLPTFPSLYTEAVLEKMESDMSDPFYWSGQFLMQYLPRTGGLLFPFAGTQFKSFGHIDGQIVRGKHVISMEDCLVWITIDPSGGAGAQQATSRHDKVGWCVNAVSLDGMWHFLELDEEYLDDTQFIDKLFELNARWRPEVIAVERMPHLDTAMRQAFMLRGSTLPISELRPQRRQKSARIRGLKPLANGIHLLEGTRQADFFKRYHTTMEHGDDGVDSAAYQVDIARPPTRQQLLLRHEQRRHTQEDIEYAKLPAAERKEYDAWIKNERIRNSRAAEGVTTALEEIYDVQVQNSHGMDYDSVNGLYH